jgi:hypothetical protein
MQPDPMPAHRATPPVPPADPTDPPGPPRGPEPPTVAPLPLGAKVLAGVLLLVPLVALAIVPAYSKDDPKLWGFPFFYWYQFLWVPVAALLTWLVYTRTRR